MDHTIRGETNLKIGSIEDADHESREGRVRPNSIVARRYTLS
jgi:hypothetical protein